MIVYRHRRNDTNQIFYIGIGKNEKRAYSQFSRNPFWKNIIAKTGYQVEIIARPKTWEDCCELEQLLILEYGRADLKTGTLVNLTNGGEGVVGNVLSDEIKKKLSNAFKGRKHTKETKAKLSLASTGRKASDETKAKLSLAKKGKPLSQEHIKKLKLAKQNISDETRAKMSIAQRNMSDETKQKISQFRKGKTSNRKGVILSDETKLKMSISKKKYWENKRKTYETD